MQATFFVIGASFNIGNLHGADRGGLIRNRRERPNAEGETQ
jgi:hypothetical protein